MKNLRGKWALSILTLIAMTSCGAQNVDPSSDVSSSEGSSQTSSSEGSSQTSSSEGSSSSSQGSSSSSEEGSSSSESSSSSSESSSSSSSSSSSEESSTVATITFDTTGLSDNKELTTISSSNYQTENVEISSISGSKVYPYDSGVRIGASKTAGSMTITFADSISIRGISVLCGVYNNGNKDDEGVTLSVYTDTHTTKETLDITENGDVLEFGAFVTDTENSKTLTFENGGAKKRAVIYAIEIETSSDPVYPTSISLGDDFSMSLGTSKTLKPTFTPSSTNQKNVSYSSSDASIVSVSSSGVLTANKLGSATITATAETLSSPVSDSVVVTVKEAAEVTKTDLAYSYQDYIDNNCYALSSSPTVGSTKLLIIPVWFTDSSTYIKTANKDKVRADIETAYLGTTSETGWNSVKSYYETESEGALTMEGTVTDWYEVGASSSSYGDEDNGAALTAELAKDASDWYFTNNPTDSRKNYDQDGNGYLDGVMLIYGAPDSQVLDDDALSNLWAYCFWRQDEAAQSKTSPGANVYFWASYDFMYDSSAASSRAGTSYGNGDCSHVTLDAHTFIHEMGHVFGLDDYYDYGPNGYCIAGGFSMQDYNVGGHDPYSVMAMGWADPYIPTESCQITISSFQSSHDLILLTPKWNSVDSPFDEYLLLELYTPTGLNKLDSTYTYDGGYPKGPSATGIRLWHVDTSLVQYNESTDSFKYSSKTSDPTKGLVYHAFSNTISDGDTSYIDYISPLGQSYEKYHELHMIRNSTTAKLNPSSASELSSSDLFYSGDSFSLTDYKSQFVSGKLNSGSTLGWSFSVSISGSGDTAKATITLTQE